MLLTVSVALATFAGEGAFGIDPRARAAGPPVSFRWHPAPGETESALLEVTGVPVAALEELGASNWTMASWQQLLAVYASQGGLIADMTLPPMLGAYRVRENAIRFEPRFSWAPGIEYRAVFRPEHLPGAAVAAAGGKIIASVFRLPPREQRGSSAVVRAVYPSGDVVPENLLKFYVHFSAPMSRGQIYSHIHLENEAGQEVELPFLEIDEELWNPELTRLTLIIDPGRIKRGVRPLEEIGPALESGKRFTLVIDRDWLDSNGLPLNQGFSKEFRVGPPDRDPLDPKQWTLQLPSAKTVGALRLSFPKPMDHALAQRVIRVVDADGRVIPGRVTLEDHERSWRFVPDQPWAAGRFQLAIDATIEDLAGNNIGKSFEVDLFERVDRHFRNTVATVPFEVR